MRVTGYDKSFIYFEASRRVGSLLGAHFIQSRKLWRVPISLEAVDELDHNGVLDDLREGLTKYRRDIDYIRNHKTITYDRLRPYQAVDAEFLKFRNAAGVFNEQRTGKTPTVLSAVKDKSKIIVVCPAGLKINWTNESAIWAEKMSMYITGSKVKRLRDYRDFGSNWDEGVLVLSYETLRNDIDEILKNIKHFDALIVDEAHRLRNYRTKQSQAIYRIGKVASKVYALTGTPAVNHPSDVFGILRLLNPSKYPSYWQFIDRYFVSNEGMWGREVLGLRKDREKEFTNMLNDISTQRKRKDVMSWIPEVTRLTIPLELVGKQATHYKRALKEFMYGEQEIPTVLAQLTRLRQICDDPALLELDGRSAKTEFIKEYINDNPDTSIIIFSSFTSYLKRLASQLEGSVLLTGEQSQAEKQAAVDAIQSGRAKVLLGNIKAAGVGFTLDSVDTIIFADRSYNPVDNDQAADRFIPTRTDKEYGAKEIIDLVMEDSIEIGINKLLDSKQNIIQYVNSYIDNLMVDLGIK